MVLPSIQRFAILDCQLVSSTIRILTPVNFVLYAVIVLSDKKPLLLPFEGNTMEFLVKEASF